MGSIILEKKKHRTDVWGIYNYVDKLTVIIMSKRSHHEEYIPYNSICIKFKH